MTFDLFAWRDLGLFEWAVVLAAGALVTSTIAMHVALVFYPPETRASTLVAPFPAIRWARSLVLRAFAAVAGWPWALLRLSGIRPVGRMTSSHAPIDLSDDGARLLVFEASSEQRRRPVLLVHAVVTEPWILDLTPETSVVAALNAAGHDVWVLDWPTPTRRHAFCGLEWYVTRVAAAIHEVRTRSTSDQIHLVGYCTGGLLALLHAAVSGDPTIASLTAVAPPLDMATPGGITRLIGDPHLRPVLFLDGHGLVPAPVVRESFHVLRPKMLSAVLARRRMAPDDPGVPLADALSAWLWHHRPVPGRLFYDTVDLTRENALVGENLWIGGRLVDLRTISAPTLVCLATRDHIVDAGSSLAIEHLVPEAKVVTCGGGHVSMMLGASRGARLHDVLTTWLADAES